jgi:hypothetical protein
MCETKSFANSLHELTHDIESTIPYAKEIGYLAISSDMSLEVAQELVNELKLRQTVSAYVYQRIEELEAEKKGQTMEVKAVLNGALVELKKLKEQLG